jgi:cell division protein FtsB
MRVFREKRRFKRLIFSKPAIFFLSLIALFIIIQASKVSFRAYLAYKEREKIEAEYKKLQEKKTELEERISRLESPEGIKREAKERFNVRELGEEVVIIVEPGGGVMTTSQAASGNKFFKFFKDLFRW